MSALLEGSVSKAGKQIRVTARLINVADGFQLWTDTYDRSIDDIIAVEDDIARRIAERLQGKIEAAQTRPKAPNPEAHALYWRARLFWNKRTEAGLKRAAQLFQEAIAKAPGYGAAHAGLASTYYLLPQYSVSARQSQYHPLARASATRALELDSSSAEAHAVLASLQAAAHDANGAEEHFRRAIQLEPSYATAHHWYGVFLVVRARRDEAWSELRTALDLDHTSPIIQTALVHWYYLGRDYDRAVEEARKVIDAFPEFPAARHILTAALLQSGRYKEALAEIDKSRALQADEPLAELEKRGYALARSGDRAEAEKILSVLEEQRQQGKPLDGAIGFVWLGLKNYDRAIEALEREEATEGLDDEMLSDPFFDELRNLPRLQALLRKS
ncbi:MAG: hypothetical protein DME25_08735 [Verrucomicrobia bacterium]|nr:MAG: hypothetical protein DME25_08735 [Verrucomicrobiota bacterium]